MAKSNWDTILKDVDAELNGEGAMPSDWISTGNYCLNKLLSGDLERGIPVGRVIALAGESGTGKSLLTSCMMREAQKKGYYCVVFDSEAAMDASFLGNLGVDSKKLAYIAVDTIEDFRIKIVKLLEGIEDRKVLFVLDSMGNLASKKELQDTLDGKAASDMGIRAKLLRATFRVLSKMIESKDATLIVTNHTYTDASGYVPMQVMSAGKGLFYNSSIVLMLKKRKLKEGKETLGVTITATTDKNRFVPPFKSIALDLNFEHGMGKYTGLLDVLIEQGIIEQRGGWYVFKEEKFRRKNFDEWAKEHENEILSFDVPSKFAKFDSVN